LFYFSFYNGSGMPKIIDTYIGRSRKRRPGVHSKNASPGQSKFKKKYRGQGR